MSEWLLFFVQSIKAGGIFSAFYLLFFIWIASGFKQGKDPQKEKKTIYIQLGISYGLVGMGLPIAFFVGVMATDSPSSTTVQFWQGFFFIEGFPVLCLLLTLSVLIKRKISRGV